MSSLSVRFFNSFKSKYLNFFFYLFDCQVSCVRSLALARRSVRYWSVEQLSLSLHRRETFMRSGRYSPDFCRPASGLVGLDGLEPSTSRLSGVRSSHLSYRPVSLRLFSSSISLGSLLDGGDEGIRTLDPLLAGQVLSQLSYTPIFLYGIALRLRLKPDN